MIFENCVLFSDIDGTLITYDKKIPERNLAAIQNFQDEGGLFTICTGRSAESLRRAFDVELLNFPAIIFNGGGIYDYQQEKYLKDSALDANVACYIDEAFEKYPDVGIEINVDNILYCVKYSPCSKRHVLTEKDRFEVIAFASLPRGQWKKVLFTGQEEDIDRLSTDFLSRDLQNKDYYFLRSEPGLFELLPTGAQKGIAVRELTHMFHIPIENVYAIGDYYNDLTMLKAAGCACAVGGAPKRVKDAADYIACRCEDGAVADFIDFIRKTR